MTIATDMIGPLVLLAQTRAALAQQPETAAFAARVQAGSAVVDRWNAHMKDVMVMEIDRNVA